MTTPLVVDVDRDGSPEILFTSYEGKPWEAIRPTWVHAISGKDCSEVWTDEVVGLQPRADLAVGDLDGDGGQELVAVRDDGTILVLNARTGSKLADLPSPTQLLPAAIAIANIDGAGPAEIVIGASVSRFEGGKLASVWRGPPDAGISIAADLDEDGTLEVIGTMAVYDGLTGVVKLDFGTEGLASVADFDPASPGPEIIRAQYRDHSAVVLAGLKAPVPGKILFGPYPTTTITGTFNDGGAPVVADFDGDGVVDFGIASSRKYTVFASVCGGATPADRCFAPGILWRKNSNDFSGTTTSSVFDFNCDEKAEVVYRDECWLRVYDGTTGRVLFAAAMTSATGIEGAAVSATDKSGHGKIVIGTNDTIAPGTSPCDTDEHTGTPFGGYSKGLYVLRDPEDRWQPTRKVWNQNSYHVTNVGEDGAIPLKETPSWARDNTYRAQGRSER